jgi:hypothetical protein
MGIPLKNPTVNLNLLFLLAGSAFKINELVGLEKRDFLG